MLKGTLDEFALTEVFRLLSASHRTGRLDLDRPAGSGSVLFLEGKVAHAKTSLSTSPLGQKLVASGALTEAQLRKVLDRQAETGRRLGQIVVEGGLVEKDDLESALKEQIHDAVFELLQWDTGTFTWERAAVEVEAGAPLEVDDLLTEVVKRLDEVEELRQRVPSTGVPVMASRPPEGADAITMSPLEWQTLVLVNGARSVSEIALSMGRPEIQTMRTLFLLVSSGLIEVRITEEESSDEASVEALDQASATVPEAPGAPEEAAAPATKGRAVVPEPPDVPYPPTVPKAPDAPEVATIPATDQVGATVPEAPDFVPPEKTVVVAEEEQPLDEDPVLTRTTEDTMPEDWFSDPVNPVDPGDEMTTGEPSALDLDDVSVSVDHVSNPQDEDDSEEAPEPEAAPGPVPPMVDRAAAARELSGLSSDEIKRARMRQVTDDEEDETAKSIFSRLKGGKS
jgi:hypothetical protein